MNVTVEGSGALSSLDLSVPRSKAKGIVSGFWGERRTAPNMNDAWRIKTRRIQRR